MMIEKKNSVCVAWHRMQTQRLSLVLHIRKMQENELISDNDYTVFFSCTQLKTVTSQVSDIIHNNNTGYTA